MVLAILFGRLITLAQCISINFLTASTLYSDMSLIILILASSSLPVVSFTFLALIRL